MKMAFDSTRSEAKKEQSEQLITRSELNSHLKIPVTSYEVQMFPRTSVYLNGTGKQ